MSDDFGLALRKNFAKLSVDGSSSTKKSRGSASSSQTRISDRVPKDSPLLPGMVHAHNLVGKAREEVQTRKAAKKDIKTICGKCGKHKDAGTRLQTCSRCRSINYCTVQCQKDHWKSGHKTECSSFKQPPFAKQFDPSDRLDVPWPHDPIFAQGNKDGLGVWLTPSGDLSSLLQQLFEPADGVIAKRDPMGPPSFQRWSKLGPHGNPSGKAPGPETKNYIGSCLLSLRIIVQNRRKDDKVVLVNAALVALNVSALMKDSLFPNERKKAIFNKSPNGIDTMTVPPWVDYNGKTRVAVLEINGFETPKGKFGADGEYQMPPSPTGEPWNRVMNWDEPQVLLAPGDYAVFRLQYHVGDGGVWNDYAEVMTRFSHAGVQCKVLQPKNPAPDNAWIKEARLFAMTHHSDAETVLLVAQANFDYIQEYYRPYFEEDADVWAEKRLGGRAKESNDMMKKMGPVMLRSTLSAMTPENREETKRRFASMGFDVDRALQG